MKSVDEESSRAQFNRNAIQPMECYRATWALVKPNYGLMLGICLVGVIIAGFGPFGLLLGPMMCGIFICFLRLQRGEPVEFNTLFRGFDHFMPGFTVAFIQVLPLLLIQMPYVVWLVWFFLSEAFTKPDLVVPFGAPPRSVSPVVDNPVFSSTYWIAMSLDIVVITVVGGILQGLLVFGYGLVVERKMTGVEAAKLSARAALANFGGVAGIIVINVALSLGGLLLFYVGAILVIPITYGVWTTAYRRVFPEPTAQTAV